MAKWNKSEFNVVINTICKKLDDTAKAMRENISNNYEPSDLYKGIEALQKQVSNKLRKWEVQSYHNRGAENIDNVFDNILTAVKDKESPQIKFSAYGNQEQLYTEISLWRMNKPDLSADDFIRDFIDHKVKQWRDSIGQGSKK
jgi:hypothetical protein